MVRWLSALFLFMWPCAEAAAEESLVGEWRGNIDCIGQQDIKFVVSIKETPKGKLAGEIEFRRGYLKSGYTLEGDGVRDDGFTLKPVKWTQTSLRIPAADFGGKFFKIGEKIGIHGDAGVCNRGIFSAFRAPEREKVTPQPPVAARGERDFDKLTKAVRQGVRILLDRRDHNNSWWRSIELSVIFSRVDAKAKEALLAEVKEAKANLFADALLEKELKSGPMTFPQGIGRALFVFNTARAKKDWPDSVKLRVYNECQKRVADVMRPELKRIAASANGIPTSLDGLIGARAALNRIDTYKASLEDAFGTVDQENILPPMRQRIAALEATPAILEELRLRLDDILKKPNPLAATDRLYLDISGFEPLSSSIGAAMREGQQRAAFAEIVIDGGVQVNPFEPSANEIARHVFSLTERENEHLARKRCQSKIVDDPWTWGQCYMGENRFKVKRVAKRNCVEIEPTKAYTCYFDYEAVLYLPATGDVTRNVSASTSARFAKTLPGDNWQGSELGTR